MAIYYRFPRAAEILSRAGRLITGQKFSSRPMLGDSLSKFALLFPRQIDENNVGVLPHPVEDNLPAVW